MGIIILMIATGLYRMLLGHTNYLIRSDMSLGWNVRGVKRTWGETYVGWNVRGVKCTGVKCPGVKCLRGEMSCNQLTNSQLLKYNVPYTYNWYQSLLSSLFWPCKKLSWRDASRFRKAYTLNPEFILQNTQTLFCQNSEVSAKQYVCVRHNTI